MNKVEKTGLLKKQLPHESPAMSSHIALKNHEGQSFIGDMPGLTPVHGHKHFWRDNGHLMTEGNNIGHMKHSFQPRAVNQYKNLIYLDNAVGYLLSHNKFFGCLQIELYIYYFAFCMFFIMLRQKEEDAPFRFSRLSAPLLSITLLYIILLIKTVRKISLDPSSNHCWVQLVAIIAYLLFILGLFIAEIVEFSDHMMVIGFFPIAVDVYRLFVKKSQFGIKVIYQ